MKTTQHNFSVTDTDASVMSNVSNRRDAEIRDSIGQAEIDISSFHGAAGKLTAVLLKSKGGCDLTAVKSEAVKLLRSELGEASEKWEVKRDSAGNVVRDGADGIGGNPVYEQAGPSKAPAVAVDSAWIRLCRPKTTVRPAVNVEMISVSKAEFESDGGQAVLVSFKNKNDQRVASVKTKLAEARRLLSEGNVPDLAALKSEARAIRWVACLQINVNELTAECGGFKNKRPLKQILFVSKSNFDLRHEALGIKSPVKSEGSLRSKMIEEIDSIPTVDFSF